MFVRNVLYTLLACFITHTAVAQSPDDPLVKEKQTDEIDIVINADAENLEAELKKAELLLKLREAEWLTASEQFGQGLASKLQVVQTQVQHELAEVQLETIQQALKNRISEERKTQKAKVVAPNSVPKFEPLKSVGLTKDDLANCKMHVIGLYDPASDRRSDEVFVKVSDLDEPSVIVVSSYSEAFWRVKVTNKVKLVIIAGYYSQTATVSGAKVPILNLTYFADKKPNRDRPWAYAYSWPTAEGRKMANMLYDITGLTVDTFQGMQSATSLTIDGKKGALTNRQSKEPIKGLLTDAERAAEPIQFPEESSGGNEVSSAVKTNIDELYAAEASVKIMMRKISDQLESSDSELAVGDSKITKLASKLTGPSPDQESLDEFRDAVAVQFKLQQKQRGLRTQLAAAKLQMVEVRLLLRDHNADEIIDKMVDALLK